MPNKTSQPNVKFANSNRGALLAPGVAGAAWEHPQIAARRVVASAWMTPDSAGLTPDGDSSVAEQDDKTSSTVPRWVVKSIALFWLGWLVVYIGTGAVRALRSFLVVLLISVFISFAVEPAVNRMETWKIRRGVGVWIVYLGALLAMAGFSAAIGTALADQIDSLVDEAPTYVNEIEQWLQDNIDANIDLQRIQSEFVAGGGVSNLAERFADDLVNLGTALLNIVFQAFTVLLFTYYLVAEGPKLRLTIGSLLAPRRQEMLMGIWDLAIEKTGGYVFSRTILATISAIAHGIAFEIINVPFPIPLALWVGVMSQFIPVIGTYFAGALPVLVSVLDEPRKALWVLVMIVAYQQVENYLLSPRITAHTMEIHVAVAFGSVLVGAALLGIVGALLALPFAATVQAFISGYLHHRDLNE